MGKIFQNLAGFKIKSAEQLKTVMNKATYYIDQKVMISGVFMCLCLR